MLEVGDALCYGEVLFASIFLDNEEAPGLVIRRVSVDLKMIEVFHFLFLLVVERDDFFHKLLIITFQSLAILL